MHPVCRRIAEKALPAGFNGSSTRAGDAVPMPPNRILSTVLAGGIAIGAASTGYVIAQFTSVSGHYAGQYQPAANGDPGRTASVPQGAGSASPAAPSAPSSSMAPSATMPSASPAGPGGGGPFDDPSLAQFIAQKAGTRLAGKAPQNVPLSQVKALSEQEPAGASIDTRADTITFHTTTASFTVVAIAPGKPDMTFAIAGLTNPTIIVPRGAQVTVRFINNDTDEAHGWLITAGEPPFGFGQPAAPAIAGAYAGVIGDPTAAGDGTNTVTFTASDTGRYQYICPMPGHAQMGMHGSFTVR
jgi:rusticyanin